MSQGDIVVIVPAKTKNFPIRAGGDFVFLKESAREIKVIVDGQGILMRRGDKRRVDRKNNAKLAFETFEVSNDYEFDLRIVLVVGVGDFNSQIVTGELSISESITTTTIDTVSLPVNFKKHFNYEERLTFGVVANVEYAAVMNQNVQIEGGMRGRYFLFDGFVYSLGKQNLYKYNKSGSLVDTTPINAEAVIGSQISSTEIAMNNVVYVAGKNGLFTFDLYTKSFDQLYSGNMNVSSSMAFDSKNNRLIIRGNSSPEEGDYVWVKTSNNAGRGEKVLTDIFGQFSYDPFLERVIAASSNNYYVLNDDLQVDYVLPPGSYEGLSGPLRFDIKNNFYLTSKTNSSLNFFHFKDKDFKHRFSVRDLESDTNFDEFFSDVDLFVFERGDKTVISGQTIKALLSFELGSNIPENYLDYIVSIEYSDGKNEYKKSAGTSSFQYRGLKDNQEVALADYVKIEFLPELFASVF